MKKIIKTALASMMFLLLLSGTNLVQAATYGVNVETHTIEEIREYMKNTGLLTNEMITYQEEPLLVAPYASGKLSDATKNSALNTLNQLRYVAGLSHELELDEIRGEQAQAAALVNAGIGTLTHTPSKPEGMSEELYQLGATGASSSNLAYTGWWGTSLNYAILNMWMDDSDSGNISRVGHRRWLLNPALQKVGFGAVKASTRTYMAVSVFDKSNTSARQSRVAWPAQKMPVEYFSSGENVWSISTGSREDVSTIEVTLTRRRDNRVWKFSQSSANGDFYVDNGVYGQRGCIIFRPEGIDTYLPGDVYDVKITGAACDTIAYDVEFFEIMPVEKITLDQETITLKESNSETITASVYPETATNTELVWSSSDEAIVEVTSRSALTAWVQAGTKVGEAIVTASTLDGSVQATCKVVVTHNLSGEASCESEQKCSVCGEVAAPALGHDYKTEVWQKASPNNNGSSIERCTRCNQYSESTKVIRAPKTVKLEKSSYTYTGEKIKPEVTVLNNKDKVIDSKHYQISYKNNKNVGTATVTIQFQGDSYKGTMEKTFTIVAASTEASTGNETEDTSVKKGSQETVGNFVYKVTKTAGSKTGTVTLVSAKKKTTEVNIPATIKIQGKSYKVTAIANKAFANNKKMTALTIGKNVSSIGTEAFRDCIKLKNITIGAGVTKIGKSAFYNCKAAKSVTIKTKKLQAKNVGAKAFTKMGSSNYKKLTVKTEKSKLKSYKKILQGKGLSKKAQIKS